MKTKTCPHCKWHVTTGKNKVVILCPRHAVVDELETALARIAAFGGWWMENGVKIYANEFASQVLARLKPEP